MRQASCVWTPRRDALFTYELRTGGSQRVFTNYRHFAITRDQTSNEACWYPAGRHTSKAFFDLLKVRGKPGAFALIGRMPKMLVILSTFRRDVLCLAQQTLAASDQDVVRMLVDKDTLFPEAASRVSWRDW